MPNGVFNFNFLALLLSEILGGSQIYTRNPTLPGSPLAEKYFTQSEYFSIPNCLFNFNILALVVSEILWGPKFTLGGPVPPCSLPSWNFFVPEASTLLYLMTFLIITSSSFTFRVIRGVPNLHEGPYAPWTPLAEKFLYSKRVLHNI